MSTRSNNNNNNNRGVSNSSHTKSNNSNQRHQLSSSIDPDHPYTLWLSNNKRASLFAKLAIKLLYKQYKADNNNSIPTIELRALGDSIGLSIDIAQHLVRIGKTTLVSLKTSSLIANNNSYSIKPEIRIVLALSTTAAAAAAAVSSSAPATGTDTDTDTDKTANTNNDEEDEDPDAHAELDTAVAVAVDDE